jgi:hypothetical protein
MSSRVVLVLSLREQRIFQMPEEGVPYLSPCDSVHVTLLVFGLASLIAYQVNRQINGLTTQCAIQSRHTLLVHLRLRHSRDKLATVEQIEICYATRPSLAV